MSETFDLFQQGRAHLKKGRAAQATVALEKAKRREPEKASIREALGIAYFRIHRWAEAESEFRQRMQNIIKKLDPTHILFSGDVNVLFPIKNAPLKNGWVHKIDGRSVVSTVDFSRD